ERCIGSVAVRPAGADPPNVRYALSSSVFSNPSLSEAVEALARKIARSDASQEIQMLARPIAESQIDLLRVRRARQQLLSRSIISEPYYGSRADTRHKAALIRHLLRWNARDISPTALTRYLTVMPEDSQEFGIAPSKEAQQLQAFDRKK